MLPCPALLSCMPTYRLLLSPMLATGQARLETEHMLTIRLSMLAEGCCWNLSASACFVLLARNNLQCIPIPRQLSVLVTAITAAVCTEWLKKRQGAKSLAQCSNHIEAGKMSGSAADLLNLVCSPLLDCHSCGPPVCSLTSHSVMLLLDANITSVCLRGSSGR
jgi:hypothetical protein